MRFWFTATIYGSSIDADFSSSRLSFADRSFVYAIVHVRCGGELGQQWWRRWQILKSGILLMTILMPAMPILNCYGSPSLCYGMGGSAGGMLMGVAINERP
ncbi:prolyl oligopeptidase family serine peptidase [Salmonella enterica subsp. enterica]|nr:prolyl oligopeptidase family serine peptidase [Salmonella enterica subsp. enterica]